MRSQQVPVDQIACQLARRLAEILRFEQVYEQINYQRLVRRIRCKLVQAFRNLLVNVLVAEQVTGQLIMSKVIHCVVCLKFDSVPEFHYAQVFRVFTLVNNL